MILYQICCATLGAVTLYKRLEIDSYYTLDIGPRFWGPTVILSEKQEVERPRDKMDWAC